MIILFAFLPWLPVLSAGFINDDFQIVLFNNPTSFWDCFNPYWTADISGAYWRPFVNSIHSLTIWFFGFEALPFRATNLLLYIALCLSVGYFIRALGIGWQAALISSCLFAVLPSHEYAVAWIAGRGDVMAAALLMISFSLYIIADKKNVDYNDDYKNNKSTNYILPAVLFLLAVLTKEIAYAGVLFPVIYYLSRLGASKFRKYLNHSAVAFLIVMAVLVYKWMFVGGSLLRSNNIADINFIDIILNFIIYLPISFHTPDFLQKSYYYLLDNSIVMALVFIITIIAGILTYKAIRRLGKISMNYFKFGLMWYALFIVPVSTLLMRWYSLTASIGLIIAIAAVLQDKIRKANALWIALSFCLIFLWASKVDYDMMGRWVAAGNKTAQIIEYAKGFDLTGIKQIVIFGAPDKYERVNMLKTGIKQALRFAAGSPNLKANSPVRIEENSDTKINFRKISNDIFELEASNARFLPNGTRSKAVIIKEEIDLPGNDFDIEILNDYNNDKDSKVMIRFKNKRPGVAYKYYNGERFVDVF